MNCKFSSSNSGSLVTVDQGTIADKHIFVWQLVGNDSVNPPELNSDLLCSYRARATFVLPHPKKENNWIIGFKYSIAVLLPCDACAGSDVASDEYSGLTHYLHLEKENCTCDIRG